MTDPNPPIASAPSGRLTTHVLDTVHGHPAAGMSVALYVMQGEWALIKQARTNADGRLDAPLLAGHDLVPGRYRLVFDVEAYFRHMGVDLPKPAFLGQVPLDFGIADGTVHYHVPLLVSPWAYSTYRGS
ncbi:hydroxyisourate hydrolase [Aquabacterium sp.]|uniref:hydroxyisourate hydrolase n=1 Tax=Aquabacterium sp. TaxID=1872578 RepID=UPI0019B7CA07|nr:hydroxyisourate hydrolase [Aquabacterium sp.]MBC7698969.1 hydroxyisourate hydrolase [Aquabacterium sp.]